MPGGRALLGLSRKRAESARVVCEDRHARRLEEVPKMPNSPVEALMSPAIVRVARDATLRDAARAMSEAGIGSVVVEADQDGLVTERDLLRPIADGIDVDEAKAVDYLVMSRPTVPPDTPLTDAARQMVERGVRHCLVAKDGETVGVLSMRDIVRLLDIEDAD